MNIQDSIKTLRVELGITQNELAAALNINVMTISRWELGNNKPNKSALAMLINYAIKQGAATETIDMLKEGMSEQTKKKMEEKYGKLFSIEHSSLALLVEEASFPIYVCDIKTDKLLYANNQAKKMIGTNQDVVGQKCYKCIMHRDAPCEFCHKSELKENEFTSFDAVRPFDGTIYRVKGRRMIWDGHNAQVRCVTDTGQSLNITVQHEREKLFSDLIRIRKENSADCVAMVHYNLTKNFVSEAKSNRKKIKQLISVDTVDELLGALGRLTYDSEEQNKFNFISDRKELIRLFYTGKTHISVKHHLKEDRRFYESTFDLMQNPSTFDIEAIAVLRDITDGSLIEEVASALLGFDYETIVLIDSQTGEAQPLTDGHIKDVVKLQQNLGNYVDGVKNYLEKHCINDDLDRIIRETSLSYVKEKLKTKKRHTVSYSLKINEKIIHKRTFYTYLDKTRTTILCAMQDLAETYNNDNEISRLSEALYTIQQVSGINIARYDLKTKVFYSNCDITAVLGYSSVINDVPEVFIRDGNVSHSSEDEFRTFFEKLRHGEVTSMNPALKVADGSFHWFSVTAKFLKDETGNANQAIIIFQDVDELRKQATVYRKWQQALEMRQPESFTLFTCNLRTGVSSDKKKGKLLSIKFDPKLETFNERTFEYANRFVYKDDRNAYITLLDSDNLLKLFAHGEKTVSINYREVISENKNRWIHLTVEMTQYPECNDVEAFLLYEKAE